jgi:hypothetical protein
MRFRKLRIAWSVMWGVACVLLVVLWLQSHSWFGSLVAPSRYKSGTARIESGGGELLFTWQTHDYPRSWTITSSRITEGPPTQLRYRWEWMFSNNYVVIACPYWALVVASAAIAPMAWLRWRFSLRTLLIATTLVAVVLGLIVWTVR